MNPIPTPTHDRRRGRRAALLAPLLCCTLAFSMAPANDASATPGFGVTPRPVALGGLPEPVRAKFKAHHADGFGDGTAVSDLVVVEYTIAPGGYFGWHQHGGPVWVVIKEGTLSLYDGGDPTCTAATYPAGSAFLDAGDHTHNARNEGTVPVVVYGTFMLPDGAALRIDAPNPGVCPF